MTLPETTRPACATYSVGEAAAIIGVSADTLYRLIREDGIPELRVNKVGRQWRISHANLDRYLGRVAS